VGAAEASVIFSSTGSVAGVGAVDVSTGADGAGESITLGGPSIGGPQ
jgi:hypothetical protein